jgi:hypothetical protein
MTTRNTNILCPNCSQAYTPGTEFCGNCGMRLTAVDRPTFPMEGNTPIPPLPPYQQFSSSRLSYTQPVVPKPPFWTRGKIIVLTVTILLLLLLIGGGLISFAYQLGRNTVSGGVSPQTTTAPGTTPIATEPPIAPPSPTPTPQVIPINQTMSCLDCQSYANYSLMVRNATVDPASGQVTMLIGVQNNSTRTLSLEFQFLKLQDMQTGTTTDGTGDGFGQFIITTHQLILVHPTFQFVPIAGHQYSLSARMTLADFTPIIIKF